MDLRGPGICGLRVAPDIFPFVLPLSLCSPAVQDQEHNWQFSALPIHLDPPFPWWSWHWAKYLPTYSYSILGLCPWWYNFPCNCPCTYFYPRLYHRYQEGRSNILRSVPSTLPSSLEMLSTRNVCRMNKRKKKMGECKALEIQRRKQFVPSKLWGG